jgi:hypothetical protein
VRFEVLGSTVSLAYGGINASGRHEQGGQTLQADGQAHPIPEAADVVSITTMGPRSLHTIGKKDGVVVGRAAYEVAENGTVMTATVSGVDGGGRTFEQVILFARTVDWFGAALTCWCRILNRAVRESRLRVESHQPEENAVASPCGDGMFSGHVEWVWRPGGERHALRSLC